MIIPNIWESKKCSKPPSRIGQNPCQGREQEISNTQTWDIQQHGVDKCTFLIFLEFQPCWNLPGILFVPRKSHISIPHTPCTSQICHQVYVRFWNTQNRLEPGMPTWQRMATGHDAHIVQTYTGPQGPWDPTQLRHSSPVWVGHSAVEIPGELSTTIQRCVRCVNDSSWWSKNFVQQSLSHRIRMYAIYGVPFTITPVLLAYIPYMDPMGMTSTIPGDWPEIA